MRKLLEMQWKPFGQLEFLWQFAANIQQTKFDVSKMHEVAARQEAKMLDDGSGVKQLYRVKNFDLEPVPEDQYGDKYAIFYSGDCYVLLYTYKKRSRENYAIYYWLVRIPRRPHYLCLQDYALYLCEKPGPKLSWGGGYLQESKILQIKLLVQKGVSATPLFLFTSGDAIN